ncbi:hypothetical protein FMUBM48_14560 [Nocardia cyriacigeorgica]|nr:hypothetical protein FMUBM48_14560 [Nocardia cyriacigeorgica]
MAGRNLNAMPPVSTILVGEWPACARCEHAARWWRRIGVALLWVMAAIFAAFVGIIAAGWAGTKAPVAVAMALVWAFFPGSLPIGMVVAVWCLKKSREPAKFLGIDDDLRLNLNAHLDFCTALSATRGRDLMS